MPNLRWSYLFLEFGALLTVLLVSFPAVRRVRPRYGLLVLAVLGLFVFWCVVDWCALALDIWRFPPGSTLTFRWRGLPLEEYVVFLIHSGICFLLGTLLVEERSAS